MAAPEVALLSRDLISARVKRRLAGKRHVGEHDWRALIDRQLPPFMDASDPETEELARLEKAKALEEIYRSRFSVLIGPAGTGKTSLLTALLSLPSVAAGGVLLSRPDRQSAGSNAKASQQCAGLHTRAILVGARTLRPD